MLYTERNEEARTKFRQEIEKLDPANLVYVDESGLDDTLCREYARSRIGKKVYGERRGRKTSRISIIAGLNEKKKLAPMYYEGYCDTKLINLWIEKEFLPCLKAGQTVIMDNASFHKSTETRRLFESKGCKLLFLPVYSPDLNPIEQEWAILKARIRKHKTKEQTLVQAIEQVFKSYG